MKRIWLALTIIALLGSFPLSATAAVDIVATTTGKVYEQTRAVPTTDVDQVFTTAYDAVRIATADWSKVTRALITCNANAALVSWGVAAAQASPNNSHTLAVGQTLTLDDPDQIRKLHIISKANGSAAVLAVTLFY